MEGSLLYWIVSVFIFLYLAVTASPLVAFGWLILAAIMFVKVGQSFRVAPVREYIPRSVKEKVLRRQGGTCNVTGCHVNDVFEFHHVIPVCEGGESIANNIVAVCPNHHSIVTQSQRW